MSSPLDRIVQQKQAFVTAAKQALEDAFKEVFDNFPEVRALRFVGYTPYFNDGEPCYYRLGDINVQYHPTGPLDMACQKYSCKNVVGPNDRFCSVCGTPQPTLQERADAWSDYVPRDTPLGAVLHKLEKDMYSIKEDIKQIFDDHAQVTAAVVNNQVVFDVQEYNHD